MSEEKYITSNMSVIEIYRLRNWASKSKNRQVLLSIKTHFNSKCGSVGVQAANTNADGTEQFKLLTTNLNEVLLQVPPEIVVVIDHDITNTVEAENRTQLLQEIILDRYGDKIKVRVHSGEIDGDHLWDHHVVLLALPGCFAVLKARGTETIGQAISYDSL